MVQFLADFFNHEIFIHRQNYLDGIVFTIGNNFPFYDRIRHITSHYLQNIIENLLIFTFFEVTTPHPLTKPELEVKQWYEYNLH